MNVIDPTQVTHKIDPNQREDLKSVYRAVHASAITTTIPEVAVATGLKRQYVAELVAVLETHADRDGNAFVIVNAEPGEAGNDEPHVWYQTWHTADEHDADDAQHWFDLHFPESAQPKTSTPRTPRNATNPADLPLCLCGCGVPVNSRSRNYKPGHDARHAGQVARAIAAKDPGMDERTMMLKLLPTDALRTKADDMATRLLRKAAARTQPTRSKLAEAGASTEEIEKVQFVSGKVKVGRWWYPAEQNMTSGSVSFTRKGSVRNGQAGSPKIEVADAKVAATFVPNPEA